MTDHAVHRRQMRILGALLTGLWAGIAIAVASAYRPGGPIDLAVALVCFLPVLVADAGVVWPAVGSTRVARVALVWAWVAAVLLAIPVLYGIAASLARQGPQSLLPSLEAAYGGAVALFLMAWISVVGLVHHRRGRQPLEGRASWLTIGLAGVLTVGLGLGFVFVAVVNDQALRDAETAASRFGSTDPDIIPPFCDQVPRLGRGAVIHIEAHSSLDNEERGRAVIIGHRNGRDERWGGSWEGPDGEGRQAYRRVGTQAWLNDLSDDPAAPGTSWQEVQPDPFGLLGLRELTMDGPPHAVVAVPRGSIVAEDLGLEIIEGARARHCRTFIDGPTALDAFLPLRWVLTGSAEAPVEGALGRWRGEMDWWIFGDGELGMASVEVSGSSAEVDWEADGVRAVLEARVEATDRDRRIDVSAPALPSSPSAAPAATLESAAP